MHRMLQRADDGGEVFLCGLLRAGEVDDEAFTSRSGDSAGEHGARRNLEAPDPHRNGDCADFAIQHGKRGFRRHIARRKARAAGREDQICVELICAIDEHLLNFCLFVRDDGSVDDVEARILNHLADGGTA